MASSGAWHRVHAGRGASVAAARGRAARHHRLGGPFPRAHPVSSVAATGGSRARGRRNALDRSSRGVALTGAGHALASAGSLDRRRARLGAGRPRSTLAGAVTGPVRSRRWQVRRPPWSRRASLRCVRAHRASRSQLPSICARAEDRALRLDGDVRLAALFGDQRRDATRGIAARPHLAAIGIPDTHEHIGLERRLERDHLVAAHAPTPVGDGRRIGRAQRQRLRPGVDHDEVVADPFSCEKLWSWRWSFHGNGFVPYMALRAERGQEARHDLHSSRRSRGGAHAPYREGAHRGQRQRRPRQPRLHGEGTVCHCRAQVSNDNPISIPTIIRPA